MTVTVTDLGNDDFTVSVGGIEILAGSSAKAIRPGDLLLAALATCTAGTIRDFATRNSVQGFEEVNASITGEVANKPTRFSDISLIIDLVGDMPDDVREYLLRVGKHCKIHNTLHREPSITVETAEVVTA